MSYKGWYLALGFAVFTGCTSTATINSVPSGAKVYEGSMFIGNTSVSLSDANISGSQKTLNVRKEGYKDSTLTIRKDSVKVGPIVGGLFFLFPFIWTLGYPDTPYQVEMELEDKNAAKEKSESAQAVPQS